MEQHFSQFPEKSTATGALPEVSKLSYQEFLFHFRNIDFIAIRKFRDFRIFREHFQVNFRAIFLSFESWGIFVEWNAPSKGMQYPNFHVV